MSKKLVGIEIDRPDEQRGWPFRLNFVEEDEEGNRTRVLWPLGYPTKAEAVKAQDAFMAEHGVPGWSTIRAIGV